MGVSRGKQFEDVIKKAFLKHPDISIDRFPDPMAGYKGIRNICDFGTYKYPFQYYFECKAFSGNTLNFKSAITKDQWDGMSEKCIIPGVVAGVIIWFIDHDITAFVPIQELIRLKSEGEKSLNVKHLTGDEVEHFKIQGTKKRVFFNYDTKSFMNAISEWATYYWSEVTIYGKNI